MSDATRHYESLLAEHYAWMVGDFETKVADDLALFGSLGLAPGEGRSAIDLGCGPGYQSVALARMGFAVTAIDTSRRLLDELASHAGALPITPVEGDIAALRQLAAPGAAVIVCMGDTLTHLPNRLAVAQFVTDAAELLVPGGKLVLSWRDLSVELTGADRFIAVKSDAERILTCFLEYTPDCVLVHDIVHRRTDAGWRMQASSYPKLRLPPDAIAAAADEAGFSVDRNEMAGRMNLLAATRR